MIAAANKLLFDLGVEKDMIAYDESSRIELKTVSCDPLVVLTN